MEHKPSRTSDHRRASRTQVRRIASVTANIREDSRAGCPGDIRARMSRDIIRAALSNLSTSGDEKSNKRLIATAATAGQIRQLSRLENAREARRGDAVAAVEIVEIDDRRSARNRGQIGDVDRHRAGQVDLLLGPRTLRARRAAVEQPTLESRRILEPDATVALQPRRILDLLLLRRVVQPDSLRVGE